MGLENFKNRKIEWNKVNQEFEESIQIVSGDVNARTVTFVITDNGDPLDLTGYSVKLAYRHINKYNYSDTTGFVMLLPTNAKIGEFSLTIPTEMTNSGSIKSNLILLNENLEQVIVSKNITFISDDSTLTDLAHEVNNNLDDFTKMLLENMPQVLRIELNDLQDDVDRQGVAISTKAEQLDLSVTNKNVASTQFTANQAQKTANQAQTTANQAESDAQTAIAKATEAQANALPLTGNAVSASKLVTPRKLGVNLQSSTYQNFDGSDDVTNVGVSGVLPIASGGTGTSDGVINTIAYANSSDGADGFTTVYPKRNLNLFKNTKSQSYTSTGTASNVSPKYYSLDGVVVSDLLNKHIVVTYNYEIKNSIGTWSGAIRPYYGFSGVNKNVSNTNLSGTHKDNIIFPALGDTTFGILTVGLPSGTTVIITNLKVEFGSEPTPHMPSVSEVTTSDYPQYVGFSNAIKTNKTKSDYIWLPLGMVSVDRSTGLLKASVMGVDYAQAHPVGSVISNSSNSTSGYIYGTWQNIGSSVIGSTTIYYWKRTA